MPFTDIDNLELFRFDIFRPFNTVRCLMSARSGGVSGTAHDDLNLGYTDWDAPENVMENRNRFLRAAGIAEGSLVLQKQVHSVNVAVVDAPGAYAETDGLLTSRKGLTLIVSTADCVPIMLFDPKKNVIGGLHCGWRGAAAGIVSVAIGKMKEVFGSTPGNLLAAVGASIEADCYPVGEEVASQFSSEFLSPAVNGKSMLDLWGAVENELVDNGVRRRNIENPRLCTRCDKKRFFSYRREGAAAGRHWAVITLTGA